MIGLAISFITGGFGKLFAFIRQLSPQTLTILALAFACVFLWVRAGNMADARDKAVAGLKSERAARLDDRERVRAASIAAAQAQRANIDRVKAEQERINNNAIQKLGDARQSAAARYERLRNQASADSRRADEVGMSAACESACRSVAGAGCDAIPALLKAAQDNTDQLMALIGWQKEQERVVTSPTP